MSLTNSASARQLAKPTLVVFLTVDQMRGDYLQRFGSQFTGGLKRLNTAGANFTQGYHDHAITETAPGHASTMSGRFPVHTGITANMFGVDDPKSPLINSSEAGASPLRFNGTTLLDWMRASDRNTRFLSVSRKDRAAILPIGRSKGDVYWYSATGNFTTSHYYANSLPKWVNEFNAKRLPQSYRRWVWNPLLPDSAYAERDSVPEESQGQQFTFPHEVVDNDELAAASLGNFPVMDELVLKFALEGVKQMQLGANNGRTDLLNISLSTTDAVGHRYGPDSKELHDQLLHVDRYLGAFFDSLFAVRDSTRIIIALTGDHGMSPFPAVRSTVTPNPGAEYVDLYPVWRRAIVRMRALGIDTMQVDFVDGLFIVGDTTSFVRAKVRVDSVARALNNEFKALSGVYRADQMRDLAAADTVTDFIARRWLHMFPPGGPVRSVVTLKQFNYAAGLKIATHGSVWDQDAWVPIVFWGAPFATGKFNDRVRVVDMAPTLAKALNVKPAEKLDGVPLSKAFRN
ncbi:MAG: alkaline phosphatase family protein [Phycisphaerae bacterium]|nr:alkaline phosphatase family protein [Gemmatimonadaceae bacterium]